MAGKVIITCALTGSGHTPSMSPYLPFFMFIVGTQRIYLRVDGKTFTRLHLNDRGI